MTTTAPRPTAQLPEQLAGAEQALERDGLVPAFAFNDPEIHELEMERLFARAWCFIGHESEIPHPGDYCLRYVGNDPFIFVRDEEGEVRLLFDGCRHRGTQVCRADMGNASHFRCSYHGWTYKNTGELVGAPAFRDGYGGERFDRREWGLLSAPRLDQMHGFYFASLDENAPSLDKYLGEMKWYLDLLIALDDDGVEVMGAPQRWVMQGNWKNPADQFCGDDYHTLFLHKSMFEIGTVQIPAQANMMGYHIQTGNGHALSFSMAPDPDDPGPKYFGYPEELAAGFTSPKLSDEQREIARRARVMVGTVFPNVGLLAVPLTHDPQVPPMGMFTWQLFRPIAPDQTEMWAWYFVWKSVPDEIKQASYRAALGNFSSSGMFEQDDAEPFAGISRSSGTQFARRADLKWNFQMGLDGVGDARIDPEFPGPGIAYWPRFEEGNHRAIYRRWLQYLSSEGHPAAQPPIDWSVGSNGASGGTDA
jgi:phenylpropionate dioxygenase-like ring-hydroxylating dioxygenase large terminal subunit